MPKTKDQNALLSPPAQGFRHSDSRHMRVTLRGIRNAGNIRNAIREISRAYTGPDGISIHGYLEPRRYAQINPNICDVLDDLNPILTIQNQILYREEMSQTAEIRIKNRTIQLSIAADRIVQRAISRKLGPALDPLFSDNSWGFRPNRSPERALQTIRATIRKGFHWAFRTDIRQFFPSIQRSLLYPMLLAWIEDQELREYIPVVISPLGRYFAKGLPQGNGLSPLLANIFLHPLDQSFSNLNYFRYGDDILVLGRSFEEVHSAALRIHEILLSMGLHLNDGEKTNLCDVYHEPIRFLGSEIRGGNVYPSPAAIDRLRQKLTEFRGRDRERANLMKNFVRRHRIGPVRKVFRRIDRKLQGLYPPGLRLANLLETEVRAEEAPGWPTCFFPRGKDRIDTPAEKAERQAPAAGTVECRFH